MKYRTIKTDVKNKIYSICLILMFLSVIFILSGCQKTDDSLKENSENLTAQANQIETQIKAQIETENKASIDTSSFNLDNLPEYSEQPYTLNNNVPYFSIDDMPETSGVILSELDSYGRCQTARAYLGPETIAKEERGNIGHVKPSGWHTVKYPNIISDLYLYNRCHLIMWKACGILDDEKNLITGTRYLNTNEMLPYEESIVNYIQNTGHHVYYKVTPIFKNNELVARGVLMEASSIEDTQICFNVFCYNIQPGITIDYLTGNSYANNNTNSTNDTEVNDYPYIININTRKIHTHDCSEIEKISDKNRKNFSGNLQELLDNGYTKCKTCNPQ